MQSKLSLDTNKKNKIKYKMLYDESKINFGKITSYQSILGLFEKIFDRQFDMSLLEWFDSAPLGGNIWYGAFENEQVVAMYGLLPIAITINKITYQGALCNNVGVIPEFQGKGLFQALGEYALADSGFSVVLGVPNSKAVKGHKRIGWKNSGVLELLSGKINQKNIDYREVKDFVYYPNFKNYYFSVSRDLSWLKWRYSKPNNFYRQSIFSDNKYIIWKEYQDKKQVLEHNDFNLVFELSGIVDIWTFRDSISNKYLKSCGFSSIMENELIIYQNQDFDLEFDPDKFKFDLGDNDVF